MHHWCVAQMGGVAFGWCDNIAGDSAVAVVAHDEIPTAATSEERNGRDVAHHTAAEKKCQT